MATYHAKPGEIVDLESWAEDLPFDQTKVIIKTEELELVRLVIPAGKEIPKHEVTGPIVIHCLDGELIITAMNTNIPLSSGHLLYLKPGDPHAVKAISDSIVLLSVIFKD